MLNLPVVLGLKHIYDTVTEFRDIVVERKCSGFCEIHCFPTVLFHLIESKKPTYVVQVQESASN